MPVILITGAARRMGRGLALEFAERGFDVGFTYHTSETEAIETQTRIASIGVQCAMAQCDIRDQGALDSAMQQLTASLGIPDVVVSNAGMYPPRRTVREITVQDMENTISVNTSPLLSIAQSYQRLLTGSDKVGRLISISSLGAIEIWKDRIDYHVSKAALVQLVKTLARGLAPQISVNTVAPGSITFPDDALPHDGSIDATNRIPMGRHGSVKDVFDAVFFFATATPYITGQFIAVDGGYHLVR